MNFTHPGEFFNTHLPGPREEFMECDLLGSSVVRPAWDWPWTALKKDC